MKQALGIIEVRGLATAVMIADILVKVAAVDLVGIEPAKGSGWMTIKVTGDVGAVQATIEAGSSTARSSQQLIATKVIPRPANSIVDYFLPKEPIIESPREPVKLENESVEIIEESEASSIETLDEKKAAKKKESLKETQKKKSSKKKPTE